ncbi:hypothetical protein [Flavihumibacter sp. ZG627]|uniref:hypothetical protein n=1 Tax=Flavihumibacter sp. ZG627 TaxID=1463156 RepID=UPI00057D6CB7|nr:hypothetical protein [Flavihumibacter sp. ZG627]KIC92019.1 hypothetical protein HY58_00065 [Flavihumibacter sp. ZG627]
MKRITSLQNNLFLLILCLIFVVSCKKDVIENDVSQKDIMKEVKQFNGHLKQTKTYPSDVVQTWIKFDLRLLRSNPTLLNNFVMMQHWAYSSIALYESVLPGMPAYRTLSGQLSDMPAMPSTEPGIAYHWPTVANTVFAEMKRYYYSNLSEADKGSTDSLEAALNERYQEEINVCNLSDIS